MRQVFDFSRTEKEIAMQEARLDQMRIFLESRGHKLKTAAPAIEKLLSDNKCVLPTYTNAYSTHMGAVEYSSIAYMFITCNAVFTTGIKSFQLFEKKLKTKWQAAIEMQYGIAIESIQFSNAGVKLQLRVRP